MSRFALNRLWHSLKQKGFLFPVNIALALILAWLVFPYFKYRSTHPVIFGRYSVRLLIFLIAITAAISTYAYLAIIGSRRVNRVLLLTLIGLFTFAEVTARLFIRSPPLRDSVVAEPTPYLEFANKPGITLPAHQFLFVPPDKAPVEDETINELGFRGKVPAQPKAHEYRIIVLGGSAAFGGFPLASSIAGQLESLFQKEGRTDVKVYNWGVIAYLSGQELSLLTRTVLDYQPDLVIVYDGANDIYFPYLADPRPDHPELFMEREAFMYEERRGSPRLPSASYLLGKSKFLTWALAQVPNSRLAPTPDANRIESLRRQTNYRSEQWQKSIAESYLANHRRMCLVASGGRFKLVTVLQPALAFKNHWAGSEPAWNPPQDLLQYFRDHYDSVAKGLKQASDNSNCLSLDLRSIFENDSRQVFVDPLHVTNEGNGEVANQIYAELKRKRIAE